MSPTAWATRCTGPGRKLRCIRAKPLSVTARLQPVRAAETAIATTPLGPPCDGGSLEADFDQPLFSNDMVTHEVEPLSPRRTRRASNSCARNGQFLCSRTHRRSGLFHLSSCRFSVWPAPGVPPTRRWRSLRNPARCCCFPPGWWECFGSRAQVEAETLSAKSVSNMSGFSSRRTSWFTGRLEFFSTGGLAVRATRVRLAQQWWHDPNYTHGFFVPVFSLFLLWERRAKLAALRIEPAWSGLVILVFALLALMMGTIEFRIFPVPHITSALDLQAWWFFWPDGSIWRRFRFRWHFWS